MFQTTIITYFKAFLVYYFRLIIKKEIPTEGLDYIDAYIKSFPMPNILLDASNNSTVGKYLAELMVMILNIYAK